MTRAGLLTIAAMSGLASVGCDAGSPLDTDRVEAPPVSLELVGSLDELAIEKEFHLVANVTDALGNTVRDPAIEWTSSDTITATVSKDGRVRGRHFGPVIVRAESEGLVAEQPLDVVPGSRYSNLGLSYFREVAFGAEYGTLSRVVRKWAGDLRIAVHGVPTPADLQTLEEVMADLRTVMGRREIKVVAEDANLNLYFAPESEFSTIDPNYEPTNFGFFWVWWGADQQLLRSQILISSTGITQEARSHLIREEITQSLGLMNDSWRFPKSIYYQGWTSTTSYTPLDFIVLEMLYRDEITAGMTELEAVAILRELPRTTSVGSVAAAN